MPLLTGFQKFERSLNSGSGINNRDYYTHIIGEIEFTTSSIRILQGLVNTLANDEHLTPTQIDIISWSSDPEYENDYVEAEDSAGDGDYYSDSYIDVRSRLHNIFLYHVGGANIFSPDALELVEQLDLSYFERFYDKVVAPAHSTLSSGPQVHRPSTRSSTSGLRLRMTNTDEVTISSSS